jgi:biotin transport system substrate-specific component
MTTANLLADRFVTRTWVNSLGLTLAGTALVALSAQIAVPMFPVPMTMQTFAVLLVGATLGASRAASSMALYLALGAFGLPIFAGAKTLSGVLPTVGYLVGFVAAAALVGLLARGGWSKTPLRVAASFAAGSFVIYGFGVVGLMLALQLTLTQAFAAGVVPFVLGDLVKALMAAALLPAAWKLIKH